VSVALSWSAAEWKAGPRVERYQVLKDVDGEFVLIGTVELEYDAFGAILGPTLALLDSDVEVGETYRYKVLAVASGGRALRSNIISVTA
jgi:hypothetical protein